MVSYLCAMFFDQLCISHFSNTRLLTSIIVEFQKPLVRRHLNRRRSECFHYHIIWKCLKNRYIFHLIGYHFVIRRAIKNLIPHLKYELFLQKTVRKSRTVFVFNVKKLYFKFIKFKGIQTEVYHQSKISCSEIRIGMYLES